PLMFFERFCKDEDIIHVYAHPTFSNFVSEYVVHHCLKGCWRSTICPEGCFPFVALFDPDIVIPPSDIHF
ncbi:hypothetical protein AMATHDRAFT_159151, partial [Amanita thiersii Skay4041]